MTAITVRSLSFEYMQRSPVLRNISFEAEAGETWAIIGRNGSGKSTLLKCIGNLLHTRNGSVLINGKSVDSYRPVALARLIAYVPQAGNRPLPPFSVKEFVLLGRFPYLGIFSLPGREDRLIAESAMELTDTRTLAERPLDTLSGGELQRVFIAAAVAQKTEVLLLDEPMSFLDPLHQVLVQRTLDQIHAEFGTTVIAITHDVNHALSRFSHICALVVGAPFFIGTSADFRKNACEMLHEVYSVTFSELSGGADGSKFFAPAGTVS